jgi:hypothetical protein
MTASPAASVGDPGYLSGHGEDQVIRGGGSAIPSANAARGVINIIEASRAVSRRGRCSRDQAGSGNACHERCVGPYAWTLSGFDQADLWDRFDNRSLSNDQGGGRGACTVGERRLDAMTALRHDAGLNHGRILQLYASARWSATANGDHLQLECEPRRCPSDRLECRDVDKFRVRTGSLSSQKPKICTISKPSTTFEAGTA